MRSFQANQLLRACAIGLLILSGPQSVVASGEEQVRRRLVSDRNYNNVGIRWGGVSGGGTTTGHSRTKTPTKAPTLSPTERPTPTPTERPTPRPTAWYTPRPTRMPTGWPTREPTNLPTSSPTAWPTNEPTPLPTQKPTPAATPEPTPRETSETKQETLSPTQVPVVDSEKEKEENTESPTEQKKEETEAPEGEKEEVDDDEEDDEETVEVRTEPPLAAEEKETEAPTFPTSLPTSTPTKAPVPDKTYPPLIPSELEKPASPTSSEKDIVTKVQNLPGVKEFTVDFSLWSSDGMRADDSDIKLIEEGVISSLKMIYCEDPEVPMCAIKSGILMDRSESNNNAEPRQELSNMDKTLLFPAVKRVGTVETKFLTWTTWQISWKVMQLGAPFIKKMVEDATQNDIQLTARDIHEGAPDIIQDKVSVVLDNHIEYGGLDNLLKNTIRPQSDIFSSVLGEEMATFSEHTSAPITAGGNTDHDAASGSIDKGNTEQDAASETDDDDSTSQLIIVVCSLGSTVVILALFFFTCRYWYTGTIEIEHPLDDEYGSAPGRNGITWHDGLASPTTLPSGKPGSDSTSTASMDEKDANSYSAYNFPDLLSTDVEKNTSSAQEEPANEITDNETMPAKPTVVDVDLLWDNTSDVKTNKEEEQEEDNDEECFAAYQRTPARFVLAPDATAGPPSETFADDNTETQGEEFNEEESLATYQRIPARFVLAPDAPTAPPSETDGDDITETLPTAGSVVAGSVGSIESGMSSLDGWSVTSSSMTWA